MSQKLSPDTALTPLPIGLKYILFPKHPLAQAYVAACAVFVSLAAHDFWTEVTGRLAYADQTTSNRELTIAPIVAIVLAKLAILAPPHELLHAWQMRRAGIPWRAIVRRLFALGNAWVCAPNYAIGFREALAILLTPLLLAAIYLPLTLIPGPYHFGVLLIAFGALLGPCNDIAVASRMWEISRTDPHVHIVERIDERTRSPKLFTISLKT